MAVGALEPQFFAALLDGLGLDHDEFAAQNDRSLWPAMAETFAAVFRTRTRDEWTRHFMDTDACVAPVLSMSEAPEHEHNRQRATFVEQEGVVQPGPAPRFSRTPASLSGGPVVPGRDTDVVLEGLGFSPGEIGKLRSSGAVA